VSAHVREPVSRGTRQNIGGGERFQRYESQTEGGEALAVSWYAVWTHSHFEQSVSHQLSSKGFAAFLPEMSVWSKRGGGQRLSGASAPGNGSRTSPSLSAAAGGQGQDKDGRKDKR